MSFRDMVKAKQLIDLAHTARKLIYQVELKEEAAIAFDKPLNTYYEFFYEDWVKVLNELEEMKAKARAECVAMGMPKDVPFSKFPHYRKLMGLDSKNSEAWEMLTSMGVLWCRIR